MIAQVSLSGKLIDALYKAKEIQDNEYQEALKWITDIIENENRPKCSECEICSSNKKLERHHIRGRKHGNECITVCYDCHKLLSSEQCLWDRSWLDPDSENKDAFLIRGFIDICELKFRKTGIEIFKEFSEILTEEFSYE
jgi:hypothetical protein